MITISISISMIMIALYAVFNTEGLSPTETLFLGAMVMVPLTGMVVILMATISIFLR